MTKNEYQKLHSMLRRARRSHSEVEQKIIRSTVREMATLEVHTHLLDSIKWIDEDEMEAPLTAYRNFNPNGNRKVFANLCKFTYKSNRRIQEAS